MVTKPAPIMYMPEENKITDLTEKKVLAIIHDPVKSAEAVQLVYVTDSMPGIARIRKGKAFYYQEKGKTIRDEKTLQRIKNLVIPPAWKNVWICDRENGHLQATGIDLKKRKQYKYHPLWNNLRSHTKFSRLHAFGEKLPSIRLQVKQDLDLPGLPLPKVLATIVSLLETTNIRLGSGFYERNYGSYGLSTLKDKHVKTTGTLIRFSFRGKKGVQHNVGLRSKKLARIIQRCKDIPGQELFQFYDDAGERHSIDSGMINNYIKELSEGEFTAKDFRTWAGTLNALIAFRELGISDTDTEIKKKTVQAVDKVSLQLGNTRMVCKKYYIHPLIISMYENNTLDKYLRQLNGPETNAIGGLTPEEKVLMKILENN